MDKDLCSLVKDAGIVGAGGAGFPTHVKLNAKAEYVIVNGAECEPLLRVDQQLMDVECRKILEGLKLVKEQVGAKYGVIALKEKYKKAINSLEGIIGEYEGIKIHKLQNFYPAGDEQIIVYEVTKRIIPEGGIPLNVGAIVSNVETIANIYDAYYNNLPVTEKYVTVTGEVRYPKTLRLPIGLSIGEAIELAGGTDLTDFVVINGGPMMGKITDVKSPITKTTKGLIVLPKDHSLIKSLTKDVNTMLKEAKSACMHCSHCSEVCPRNLLGHRIYPDKMMRLSSYNSVCDDKITPINAFLCCECRLCEYACVMDLQPWKLHNSIKKMLSFNGIKNTCKNQPEKVHPFRSYKKYPVNKLIYKLGLNSYNVEAPLTKEEINVTSVSIPLSQHIGAPAVPEVQIGDKVHKGDLIAYVEEDKLGSNIHSSVDGVISDIRNNIIIISGGM
ncbi:Nitrogen fixation protein rnfC [uncultured Clostridium sp.]|nr:Nitrogen fixation protein rnfC [uncultured Clostridium sp.]